MSKLRDQIIAVDDIPVEQHDVPEWSTDGEKVTLLIKGMTGAERALFMKGFSNEDGGINWEGMYPSLLIKTLCDPTDGSRVFMDTDRDLITQKSGAVLERLSRVAFRLSGMGAQAVEEAQASFPERQ